MIQSRIQPADILIVCAWSGSIVIALLFRGLRICYGGGGWERQYTLLMKSVDIDCRCIYV